MENEVVNFERARHGGYSSITLDAFVPYAHGPCA